MRLNARNKYGPTSIRKAKSAQKASTYAERYISLKILVRLVNLKNLQPMGNNSRPRPKEFP